jgi:hypothetical protein
VRRPDVVVTEEAPDAELRSIGTTDAALPEDDDIIVYVDPEIARQAITDDIKPLWP